MQAIETKYFGPGNVKGSRVKATTASGHSITLHWDYGLNPEENHMAAANALKNKLKWGGTLIQGALKDRFVHVFANELAIKSLKALRLMIEAYDDAIPSNTDKADAALGAAKDIFLKL